MGKSLSLLVAGSRSEPPGQARSKPVRDKVTEKFEGASTLVVPSGEETCKSERVEWKINTFYE
jgi:hypothetical protein